MKPRHLSPSALEAWDWCPVHRYARSYRDNVRMSPNAPVWFGQAVHAGLEAAYRGKDWELEFVRIWRGLHKELEDHFSAAAEADGAPATVGRATMASRGLYLIQSALDLGLEGVPEWEFTQKLPGLDVPVKGRVDLVDTRSHRIFDWKTTQRGWSAAMVAKKTWQPAIYSAVYEAEFAVRPTFAYVILPVLGAAPAYVLEAPRTPESQEAAIKRAQEILELIRADEFGECTCPPAYRPRRVSVEAP